MPYEGDSILIGIVDGGYEYGHPVFYDTSLTHFRIVGAWDHLKHKEPHLPGSGTGLITPTQLRSLQLKQILQIHGEEMFMEPKSRISLLEVTEVFKG